MNPKYLLSLLLSCLISTQTLPIITCARVLEKKLINGLTQRVYLFGDLHTWLWWENATTKNFFRTRHAHEQERIIAWAKKDKLNAWVLAEDLYEDDETTGNYQLLTKISHVILQGTLAIFGADTCLAHLTTACTAQGITTTNIEARQNTSALLSIFAATPIINKITSHGQGQPTLITALYYTCIASCAYGAWHQHQAIANSIESSAHKNSIEYHWEKFFHLYAKDKWLVGATYAWVDVKALATILNNPHQQNFFVCAGDMHCYNLEQALVAQGYQEIHRDYDPCAFWSHGSRVTSSHPLDLDAFIKKINPKL